MPKKDDPSIVRARDFQQVDEDLTSAMESLDEANLKIQELLNSSQPDLENAPTEDTAMEEESSENATDAESKDDPSSE